MMTGKTSKEVLPPKTTTEVWLPFPQRLQRRSDATHYAKFLEIFKKVEINIPFLDASKEMSKYAKFLKDIMSKKKRFLQN